MFESHDPMERLSGEHGTERWELREKVDLPVLAVYAGRRMRMVLASPGRLHDTEQLRFGLGHLRRLLLEMAADGPETPIGDLVMVTDEELVPMFGAWQGRLAPLPEKAFHRLLEDQASRTAEATALEFEAVGLRYAEVHAWANRMARRLRELASPGDRLCVVLDRCPEQPVVWLAALKAGLVYAPIDPGNPRRRMEFFLKDLSPAVVLTQRVFAEAVSVDGVRVVCLDDPEERRRVEGQDASNLEDEPLPESPACILYTSGSTGTPKGSVLTHRGLRHFWVTLNGAFDIGPGDRVLLACPTSFDGSLWDMGQALQTGATMVGAPAERMATGQALAELLVKARITAFMPTPTRLRDLPSGAYPDLRWVLPAGEVLPAVLVERWGHERRVMNIFGPTECTVWATGEECVADGSRPVVGRLRENVRGYVLDDAQKPVPVGVPGQLFIGGSGVGAGYWNRPELTAERFVADPFSTESGARMYRTGDRVRWLSDGRLDFIERIDHQVKYRGARIELGEIEANLAAHPGLESAAVVLVDEQLVAWVVARVDGMAPVPTLDQLRAWLSERIQLFFIPGEFRFVKELPRTISGKVDRADLVERERGRRLGDEAAESPAIEGKGGRAVPRDWGRNDGDFPRNTSVVDLFRAQVLAAPDAVAVEDGERRMTYAELDKLSDAVAVRWEREGIRNEEAVGVVLDRGWEFLVTLLGILKAGGSYLPLGVDTPPQRLAYLLKDSGVRWVVTDAAHTEAVKEWVGMVWRIEGLVGGSGAEGVPAGVPSDPTRRAYIIYTSGSTGQPKGVEIEHHSLSNLVWHYRERLGLKAGDRATLLAHVTFDASVADIWPALCTGGTVLIPPKSVLADVEDLMAWLVESRATFTFVATALAEVVLERPWPATVALRHFATGGDTLHRRPRADLPFTILNTYGPTENTVDSTWAVVGPGIGHERPSIGRPIRNVRAYVVDELGREVGVGQEGELLLGGEQVARGYLGRPELTAEKFVTDVYSGEPGRRLYRTGDWVRWNEEGELEFLGRRDDQVQIRGRRVELGEIECRIRACGGVDQVCCVPEKDGEGIVGVVAHVVPAGPAEGLVETLRAALLTSLPAYMVPGRFVVRDGLPRNAAGKVDRSALKDEPPPTRPAVELNTEGDGLEQALLRLWWQLFPTAKGTSGEVRFWDLGGDSLMAIRLVLGVQEITGLRMPVSSFLMDPTLSGLTRAVKGQMVEGGASRLLALRRRGSRPPLFCVYAVGGDVGVYFALADALGEDQPVFGIRSPAAGGRAEDLPKTMEEAAVDVIRWIRTVQPEGPPAVVGYSFGGMLAFEVGRQLVRAGGEPPFLAVLGAHPPVTFPGTFGKAWHFVRWFPHWLWRTTMDRHIRQERLGRFGGMVQRARETFQESTGAPVGLPEWARHPIVSGNIQLALKYRPSPIVPVRLDLFRETKTFRRHGHPLEPAVMTHLPDAGWGPWTGTTPRVHWLEAAHDDVYRHPGVQQLAVALREAMDAHAERRAKHE
jgi:amino acid adenylation domain-containing protein